MPHKIRPAAKAKAKKPKRYMGVINVLDYKWEPEGNGNKRFHG